jgi:hypothetical protein
MKRRPLLLILLFVGLGSSAPQRAVAASSPAPVTLSELPLPSERVLYRGNGKRDYHHGWPASNEFDYGLDQVVDHRPADVFMGFGNNTVWDLALRRHAKQLIIGDADEGVLRAQEFLFRPLIMMARSPQEFVAMLGAVRLPRALQAAPLTEVFNYVEQQRQPLAEGQPARAAASRRFIQKLAERIAAHPDLGPRYAQLVAHHLTWSLRPRMWDPLPGLIPIQWHPDYRGTGFSGYGGQEDIYGHFKERYDKRQMTENGSRPENLTDPMFSVLSSKKAFSWLKRRFANNDVYYVVGDVRDPGLYAAVGAFTRRTGRRVDGISLNNIPDFAANNDPVEANRIVDLVARSAREHLGAKASFAIYRTMGTQPPHEYRVEHHFQPAATRVRRMAQLRVSGKSSPRAPRIGTQPRLARP